MSAARRGVVTVTMDLTWDQLLSLTLPASRPYRTAIIGAPNSTVVAPDGDVALRTGGNDVLVGGNGDNTFFVYSGGDSVIEQPNAGVDTVVSTATFVLPDNVENLKLVGNGPTTVGSLIGVGNALNNWIIGDSGNQTLDGGGGNDILTGGAGNDLFIIKAGQGSDLITDFGNGNDMIRLQGFGITSFAQVQAAATQVGNDVVIQLSDGEALGLKNVSLGSLAARQFQLDLDRSNLIQTFGDEFDSFSRYDPVTNPGGTWRTVFNNSTGIEARNIVTEGEKQVYTDQTVGVNPFSTSDGVLTIAARDMTPDMQAQLWGYKYTSGMLTSKMSHSQLYGVFEIRAQLPDEKSAWPAFWLLPTNNSPRTEIDIFEHSGIFQNLVTNTLHSGATGFKTTNGVATYVGDMSTAMHTYAVDWEPDTITWYVDGVQTYQQATPADMHQPMYMLATLGIGSNGLLPAGPLNADMKIDYIRSYERGTAITGTGSNDDFTIDSRDQIVVEPDGGTGNTVHASIDYMLPANVQTLVLTGTAGLHGYANEHDSTLIGNSGNSWLEGSFGNDLIIGGNGTNTLIGNDGNDTIIPGTGSNTIKGGNGSDTLVLAGRSGSWNIALPHGTGTITSKLTGAVETAASIENVRFDNGVMSYEGYGMTGAAAQLYRLYYTALGRAPTASELAAGLALAPAQPLNWTEPFSGGLDLAGAAARLMAGSEFQADTAGMSIARQVHWFYQAALLRPGDAGGEAYWQDLAAQGTPLAKILTGISESADVLKQTNGVTVAGLFVPDNPATAPVAPNIQGSVASGGTWSVSLDQLVAGASDPGGQTLSVTNFGRAQHGTVTQNGGLIVFTANSLYYGDASFTYTIMNADRVATTATVTLHVGSAPAPGYIYDAGSTADRMYDFSGDMVRHQVVAGSGSVTILAGGGGGSYRLGSGWATVIGGDGADAISFGSGAATVTGGGGADSFALTKGMIVDPATNGGSYDTITDFQGAGNGAKAGDDMLRLVGFSSAAKLSYAGDLPGDPTAHIYAVDDGTYHASFVVHFASSGVKLVPGDYGFFAA